MVKAYKPKYEKNKEEFIKRNFKYSLADFKCIETIIKTQCKPDRFNIMCLTGVGDNFIRLYADRFIRPVREYNYIIPKGHEILCEIMGIEDYTVLDTAPLKEFILQGRNIPTFYESSWVHTALNASCKGESLLGNYIGMVTQKNFRIIKSWDILNRTYSFLDFIIANTVGNTSRHKIDIQDLNYDCIPTYDKYKNSVLLLPDSNSTPELSPLVWDRISEHLCSLGYEVLADTKGTAPIHSTKLHNTSLKELLSIGLSCKSVISIRNGICDCLMVKGKDLHILNPTTGNLMYDTNCLYKNPKAQVTILDKSPFFFENKKIIDKVKFDDILPV